MTVPHQIRSDISGRQISKPTALKIGQLRDACQQLSLAQIIDGKYKLALCDESVSFPFQLTSELLHRSLVFSRVPVISRPKAIFDYLHTKISYDDSRRETGYAKSTDVWKRRQGICGEMTYLYVSMARFAGLACNYVQVSVDVHGKKVHHACAGVVQENEAHPVLVDIAYHVCAIHHKQWKSLSDERAWELFKSWQ